MKINSVYRICSSVNACVIACNEILLKWKCSWVTFFNSTFIKLFKLLFNIKDFAGHFRKPLQDFELLAEVLCTVYIVLLYKVWTWHKNLEISTRESLRQVH